MQSPLGHAATNVFALALVAAVIRLLGGWVASSIGRDCPRTLLHGRYVLAWMTWSYFACGVGRIVVLLCCEHHSVEWNYVGVYAGLGLLLGWPIGSLHGWFMLPPNSDGIDEDRSPGPHSS